jgi:NTP pyrophosphatase (non-canonical NTP hydrolase)
LESCHQRQKGEKMIQKYFAGELRMDQEESWKSEDGIFVKTVDHLTALNAKDEELNTLAKEIHDLAVEKGWYDVPQNEDAYIERMCNNLHDEISELHEAWRDKNLRNPCDKTVKMIALHLSPLSCLEEELADIIIRTLDSAIFLGVDIEKAVKMKHSYNKSRAQRNGGKKS